MDGTNRHKQWAKLKTDASFLFEAIFKKVKGERDPMNTIKKKLHNNCSSWETKLIAISLREGFLFSVKPTTNYTTVNIFNTKAIRVPLLIFSSLMNKRSVNLFPNVKLNQKESDCIPRNFLRKAYRVSSGWSIYSRFYHCELLSPRKDRKRVLVLFDVFCF